MPHRILREGLLDSDAIGAVSSGAEMLFVRLLLLVDDFGRYDGRVSVVCRRAFVNRRAVDEHMTAEWLTELHDAELIVLYEVDGKPYLEVLNFRQRTRAHGSKYPQRACPAGAATKNQALSDRNDGHSSDIGQTDDGHPSDACPSDDGPPRTYSYSDSYSKNTPLPPSQGETGGDAPRGSASASSERGARGSGGVSPIGIKAWLERCKEAGEKPIPEGSPALRYAADAGIPPEYVALHWREFKARHADSGKRYRDWRQVFLNSLRGNWYGLWLLHSDGACRLSTKGEQARRVAEASQREVAGGEA